MRLSFRSGQLETHPFELAASILVGSSAVLRSQLRKVRPGLDLFQDFLGAGIVLNLNQPSLVLIRTEAANTPAVAIVGNFSAMDSNRV